MKNRLLLWGGALALATAALASPKTYDVVLASTAKAGTSQLAPGEYKLKVEGSNAIFTSSQTHQSVTVPVKVENSNTKYRSTAVDTVTKGNAVEITSIELGGSNAKLEFSR